MRFHWFHLMPYPFLPDDFQEKYRSVWVDVPSSLYDPEKGHRVYNQYLDQLEFADGLGFDGICVNEHHQNAYGLMPSPNLMAAALARRSSQAALVVMGNSIALYNPPIRVAEEFAMLDVLSGGRLVAGFPVGTSMDTNFCYGVPPATLRERYDEAHRLIIQAWSRAEPFAFNGKYTQLRYVNIWPRPLQKPHPPIWIPGGGSIETWDFCLEYDYMYSYLSYYGYKRAQRVMDGFWQNVAKHGQDANPYRAGYAQIVVVADNDREAERLYAPHIDYFFNRCLHVYPGFADAPGYRTQATLRAGFVPQVGEAASAMRAQLRWKDFLEHGFVVAGSAATVRDMLREIFTNMHVGHVMLLCQMGDMPDELARENTQRFAQDVMPYLRDLWSEYEDRWYPKPWTQGEPVTETGKPASR
jgi:alkanesulfonate monooxygenase SsuD/methylene tetrahydromethanopterin reductase-like flavin-dependent oxidoreductase (luciferase family)